MRLTDDMRAHASKLRRRAEWYRMTDKALASASLSTARALGAAVVAMDELHAAEAANRRD